MTTTYIYRVIQGRQLLKSLRRIHSRSTTGRAATVCDHCKPSRRDFSSVLNSRYSASSSTIVSPINLNTINTAVNCWRSQVPRIFSCAPGVRHASDTHQNTYDQSEVDKFSRLSKDWWNEHGEFGALHSLNTLRVPLVRDALLETTHGGHSQTRPLIGLRIVDVGCGGGILSEPLARLGAEVLGVDASSENIAAAEAHAAHDAGLVGHLSYRVSLVENLAAESGPLYDGVVASEVLEHVAEPSLFVQACCELLKPGGSVFFTTMNRTQVAYALAVVVAERVLKVVPAGAHDWNKFVTPEELSSMLQQNGADVRLVRGMKLNPFSLRWCWSSDTSVNYGIHAVKQ